MAHPRFNCTSPLYQIYPDWVERLFDIRVLAGTLSNKTIFSSRAQITAGCSTTTAISPFNPRAPSEPPPGRLGYTPGSNPASHISFAPVPRCRLIGSQVISPKCFPKPTSILNTGRQTQFVTVSPEPPADRAATIRTFGPTPISIPTPEPATEKVYATRLPTFWQILSSSPDSDWYR